MADEFNPDQVTITTDDSGIARAPGGAAGDMMADGSVPWTGVQVPNADNTINIGTALLAFLTAFINAIRPGSAQALNLRTEDGTLGIVLLSNNTQYQIHLDAIPNLDNARAIGSDALQFLRVVTGVIKPGSGGLGLQNASGTTIATLPTAAQFQLAADLTATPADTLEIGAAAAAFLRAHVNETRPGSGQSFTMRSQNNGIVAIITDSGLQLFSNFGVFGNSVAQQAALTAADASVIDATYGATEEGVLNNVRTRVNEIEARLQAYGFLP